MLEPLDQIWHQVAKQAEDGKKYIDLKGLQDLMYIYMSGFVDARKYSFKQWLDSFASSRQPNGHYRVTYEQWMEKKKYHYAGPIKPPFDPMTMEERDYTEQEVTRLLTDRIVPGTMFNPSYVPTIINYLKAQGRLVNGKFRVDLELKKYLLSMMNQFPSPMRVLEISVDRMRRSKKGDATLAQQALQKSGFTAGSSAQMITQARLANILGTSAKGAPPSQEAPKEAGISLKDLQKKRPTSKV